MGIMLFYVTLLRDLFSGWIAVCLDMCVFNFMRIMVFYVIQLRDLFSGWIAVCLDMCSCLIVVCLDMCSCLIVVCLDMCKLNLDYIKVRTKLVGILVLYLESSGYRLFDQSLDVETSSINAYCKYWWCKCWHTGKILHGVSRFALDLWTESCLGLKCL